MFSAASGTEKHCGTRLSDALSRFECSLGTEELGHLEMVGTLVHQLTRNLTEEQIKTAGFDAYFVDHTTGIYPTAASGFPWSAASIGVKGDVICDLTEDLAADAAMAEGQHESSKLSLFEKNDG